jgi:hypothetical protein
VVTFWVDEEFQVGVEIFVGFADGAAVVDGGLCDDHSGVTAVLLMRWMSQVHTQVDGN